MNSDSESLQYQLLTWLLAINADTDGQISGNCEGIDGVKKPAAAADAFKSSKQELEGKPHLSQLGEIPTVQERFQAVLKRRLQIHIENHPPLFPWESQLVDYPDYVDNLSMALVPVWVWAAQQSKLNLPIHLPEKIFQQLLDKCQALLISPQPLGAKLVQVVESFFPNDSQALNDLAGLVLRLPYRSGNTDTSETMLDSQNNYSDLQPPQQMALSLIAAKQLLENLTVSVSAIHPVVERQWLTNVGVLTLKVEHPSQTQPTLRVRAEFPTKGILKLKGENSQVVAQCSSPGCLSVELRCTQLNQTYLLEVELTSVDQPPLLFAIIPTM
ncbi:MAG: PatU [Rhizonema sp. PD38]|nr:PatU [Rhizonema sp. PD38]